MVMAMGPASTAVIWKSDEQVIPTWTDCCHFSASLDLELLFLKETIGAGHHVPSPDMMDWVGNQHGTTISTRRPT